MVSDGEVILNANGLRGGVSLRKLVKKSNLPKFVPLRKDNCRNISSTPSGYRVRLYGESDKLEHNNTLVSKNFNFSEYGGSESATFIAARKYRDKYERMFKDYISNRRWKPLRIDKLASNNKSGVTGVCYRVMKRKNGRPIEMYTSYWNEEKNIKKQKTFCVTPKRSKKKAFIEAICYRLNREVDVIKAVKKKNRTI